MVQSISQKIALISDIHLGARNDQVLFLNNIINFFNTIFIPYLIENKINIVFILGDVWDKRKILNINTLYRCKKEIFDQFMRHNIHIKMIYGNHDVFFKNTNDINSIDVTLGEYNNIEIIQTQKVININDIKFGFVSWITPERKQIVLDWLNSTNADIICGHFEVDDFHFPDGIVYKEGISTNLFKKFELVFSGHYHIRSNNKQFYYLGSASEITWGDYGISKGFHVFDTGTREIQFIHNPYTIHEKIIYEDSIDINSFDYSKYHNKIVIVYLHSLLNTGMQKFNLFLDKLSLYTSSVETQEIIPITDNENIQHLSNIDDTMDLIKQYIESTFKNSTQISCEKLLSHLSKLYINASVGNKNPFIQES